MRSPQPETDCGGRGATPPLPRLASRAGGPVPALQRAGRVLPPTRRAGRGRVPSAQPFEVALLHLWLRGVRAGRGGAASARFRRKADAVTQRGSRSGADAVRQGQVHFGCSPSSMPSIRQYDRKACSPQKAQTVRLERNRNSVPVIVGARGGGARVSAPPSARRDSCTGAFARTVCRSTTPAAGSAFHRTTGTGIASGSCGCAGRSAYSRSLMRGVR